MNRKLSTRKPNRTGYYWFREAPHRCETYLVEVTRDGGSLVFECALVGDECGTCSRFARFGLWRRLAKKEFDEAIAEGWPIGRANRPPLK